MTTTESIWDTGTYDLLVNQDPDGAPGDLVVVVFAHPADPDDREADDDAPILADVEVLRGEYDAELPEHLKAIGSCGENGLIRPEDIEKLYGPRLGVRIMLALFTAAENDFNGMDIDGQPWRGPSAGAFPMMQRTHTLLMDLKRRLF
jgi:hypothetical protein